MIRRLFLMTITSWVVTTMVASLALGLNEGTHRIINEKAAKQSQLNQVLKEQLGFLGGIEEQIGGASGV